MNEEYVNSYPMEFISHHKIGLNPADVEHGLWDTREEAVEAFVREFMELSRQATGHFLFVRLAPEIKQSNHFSGGSGWLMGGRFSIAKIKEEKRRREAVDASGG